jgi:hypothetical protein
MEMNLTEFSPKAIELQALVAKTKNITATDLKDKAQLAVVKASRIELRNARVAIEKLAKSMREEAQGVVKQILAAEKEHIAIITPEEDRLAAIEDEAKAILIREERERKAPERRIRLHGIGGHATFTDDEFVQLDDVQFEAYYNGKVAAKNEADAVKQREEQEAKQRELDERQAKIDKAEADEKRRVELAAAEKRGAELAAQKAKEQALLAEAKAMKDEADALAAKEKLEGQKKYQKWLAKHNVTEGTLAVKTHVIERSGDTVKLYSLTGIFQV